MKKLNLIIYAILALLIIGSQVVAQTTYYVSTGGSNSNNGLSAGQAFATLQYAVNKVTQGDSVLVLDGEYTGFDIRKNGTASNPIVFKALGNNVAINVRNAITPDGINIENANWIVIDGFIVVDQPRAGIRVVLSSFVKIINNTCTRNYKWGIFTGFTDDITIENNSCSFSEDEHGIYVSNSSDRPVIRNNHCFNNSRCGIHMNGDISMGGDGIISNAIVAANILHDNGVTGGSAINMDGVQDSEVYNNLIYNNHATGIALYKIDGGDGSKNNKVYNNTIIQPSDGRWNILVVDGSTGNTIYNNILINHHTFRGSINVDATSLSGLVSNYNILVNRFSNNGGSSTINFTQWKALGYDQNSIIADPENQIFVNHLNGDFHLKQTSQAVDIGTNLVLPTVIEDIEKVMRPQGTGFDIGAYEFFSVSGINYESSNKDYFLLQNYPNPFNPVTNISWQTPDPGRQVIKIFDILGREIATLIDEYKEAGNHTTLFDASGLTSGIYFYKLYTEKYSEVRKMILLR